MISVGIIQMFVKGRALILSNELKNMFHNRQDPNGTIFFFSFNSMKFMSYS